MKLSNLISTTIEPNVDISTVQIPSQTTYTHAHYCGGPRLSTSRPPAISFLLGILLSCINCAH